MAENKQLLGYTPEEYKVYRKNALIALWGFAILYALLYGARLNMARAIPVMTEEMGWTAVELGVMSSVLFVTYGVGHLFNGRLGEIFGLKKFIVAGALLSVAANLLISTQSSIMVIAVIWGFNGYFQSMLWSPGMGLISRWWPGAKRGFATGLCNAFSSFGTTSAWLLVVAAFALMPSYGWRAAFIFPCIFLVVGVIIFAFVVKMSPSQVGLKDYVEPDPVRAEKDDELRKIVEEKGKLYPYFHLLKNWRFIFWCLIVAGSNLARYGLLTWIPQYSVSVFEVDPKSGIGFIVLPLGMAFGTWFVPWFTDKYCPNNRVIAVIVCSLIAAATVFIFPRVQSYAVLLVLLFVAGFFIYSINGVVWAFATDVGGRAFAATATGILDACAYGGAALQGIVFGIFVNNGQWNLLFISVMGVCLFTTLCGIIARPRKGEVAFK